MTKKFDILYKEYLICFDKAKHLESFIWQTASIFSIGSILVFVTIATKYERTHIFLLITFLSAMFVISISFVWWRFAKRWWSIMHLQFDRMSVIDKSIKFEHNTMVRKNDIEWISYRHQKNNKGTFFHQAFINKDKYIKEKLILNKKQPYEYRGIQPMCKLMVCLNVTVWTSFVIITAILLETLPVNGGKKSFLYPIWEFLKNSNSLIFITVISFLFFLVVNWCFWRKT